MAKVTRLTEHDGELVSAAVSTAEAKSAGEIVTIVSDRSHSYADVALLWSVLAAFLALIALAIAPNFYLGLYDRLTGGWAQQWSPHQLFELAAGVAMLKFTGAWLLLLWQPLRLLLVPHPFKHSRVRERAVTLFRAAADQRTSGRTGILIYLSLAEHRAEIVADEAISSRVSPEVWGEAMAAMIAHLRDGRIGEGMAAAVERVGAVLAEHLPRAGGDINELPDRLIEV